MPRHDAALVLFTLSPAAEARRKPLAGVQRSAALFAALIDHLGSVCRAVRGVDLILASPDRSTLRDFRHLPQRGADFGESLRLVFEDCFTAGYRRVLVIGNDAPDITAHYLRRALQALTAGPAVVGPSHDGGYALLGLSRPCRGLFDDIPWGTSTVAARTRLKLHALGSSWIELPPLRDIDDARALQRWLGVVHAARLTVLVGRIRALLAPSRWATPLGLRGPWRPAAPLVAWRAPPPHVRP